MGATLSAAAIRRYARATDPRVVPHAMRALDEVGSIESKPQRDLLEAALQVFIRFPVPEAAPALAGLYRRLPTDATAPAGDLRDLAVFALANARQPATVSDLKAAIVDYSLGEPARCYAAAALVELDDEAGRIYLLTAYDRYRQRIAEGKSRNTAPFETLSQMQDVSLQASIRKLIAESTGTLRNNARSILNHMQDHERRLDELRRSAADNDWSNSSMRYRAVAALGAVGTPEDAVLLLNLKRWDVARWPPEHLQNRMIQERGLAAVNHLKRRYWREILIEMKNKGRLGGRPGIRIKADEHDFPLDALMGEPHWVVDEAEDTDPEPRPIPPEEEMPTPAAADGWLERLWNRLTEPRDEPDAESESEPQPPAEAEATP